MVFLNNNGLNLPWLEQGSVVGWGLFLMLLGTLLAYMFCRLKEARGPWRGFASRRWPALLAGAVLLPLLVYALSDAHVQWEVPVQRGQYEAARALGFTPGTTLRQLIVPQAIYPMIPQITNTYLNIVKNSSLGVVIGFMELVSSTGGTTLNQTGQAIECIALVMGTYCAISLMISLAMNIYNHRIGQRGH